MNALPSRCAFLIGLRLMAQVAGATVYEVGDDGSFKAINEPPRLDAPRSPSAATRLASASPDAAQNLVDAVRDAAIRHNISPALANAVAQQESGYDPSAVSPAGAVGVMQLMPDTARALGVDPRDPADNIEGGIRYLRMQLDRFDGDIRLALAAYNAGPERVARLGRVPRIPETQAYVTKILDRLNPGFPILDASSYPSPSLPAIVLNFQKATP